MHAAVDRVPTSGTSRASITPLALRQVLAGDVDDSIVQSVLARLSTDPCWRVLVPIEISGTWYLHMVFQPTGQPLGFTARRPDPTRWTFGPAAVESGTVDARVAGSAALTGRLQP